MRSKPKRNRTLSQTYTVPTTGKGLLTVNRQNKRILICVSTWLRYAGREPDIESRISIAEPLIPPKSTVLADFVLQRSKCFRRGLIACLVFNHLLTSFCSSAEVPV
jgi:hypothetical protein